MDTRSSPKKADAGRPDLWSLHRRHPWLAKLTLPLRNLATHAEWALAASGLSTNGYDDLFESGLRALLDGLTLRYGR